MTDFEANLTGQRVLVVPNEFPLPVNAGGRVDVWRRLRLLKSLGAATALLTWYDQGRDGTPAEELLVRAAELCAATRLTPITRQPAELLRRLVHLGRLPSHAASRWVTLDRKATLAWVRSFRPTVILADGLYGVAVVRWLSDELRVPWVYRSHNIEHAYMRIQMAQSAGFARKLGLAANLWGLKSLEYRTVGEAAAVLDISTSDMAFWRDEVRSDICWLPTLVDETFVRDMHLAQNRPRQWDALYFGNLNTPNNVRAVAWLATEVLPLLQERDVRIGIAGSRPCADVLRFVDSDTRLHLVADPPEMASVVGSARVLLNPVQGGSGVNLKSVEMLHSNAWLLSTPSGVQGLPADAAACFELAADAGAFARALSGALGRGEPDAAALRHRHAACLPFSPTRGARLLATALTAAPLRAMGVRAAGATT
jgi:polysaccharide biosynthesis protein PslH